MILRVTLKRLLLAIIGLLIGDVTTCSQKSIF